MPLRFPTMFPLIATVMLAPGSPDVVLTGPPSQQVCGFCIDEWDPNVGDVHIFDRIGASSAEAAIVWQPSGGPLFRLSLGPLGGAVLRRVSRAGNRRIVDAADPALKVLRLLRPP